MCRGDLCAERLTAEHGGLLERGTDRRVALGRRLPTRLVEQLAGLLVGRRGRASQERHQSDGPDDEGGDGHQSGGQKDRGHGVIMTRGCDIPGG